MRIGTIRRSAWSARGGALSATTPSTGIAVSLSPTAPATSRPRCTSPPDRVVEHSRNEHRPAGGRRDELQRHHERACRPGRQPRASGCGSGGHAVGARTRSASRRPPGPSGRREQALLWRMQSPRRKSPRSAAGADGGLLPPLRGGLFLHAEALAGRSRRRPVLGRRMPRPWWIGMDLSRPGQERRRHLGGAQGLAGLGRHVCHGSGRSREAIPGRGQPRQHRRDQEFRPA